MFGILKEGWIALGIWFTVILIPWTYSLYFIYKINKSGVERWGAKPLKGTKDELLEEEAGA